MPRDLDIAVLVGSLRHDSLNRKVALALQTLAPAPLRLDIVEISHLPLYNQDSDTDSPSSYTAFRERIAAADGVVFVTPEHNRSMPAALKNALDIASRPPGRSVWNKKPGAIISASPSLQGGFGATHHLRQSLSCLNVYCMQQPETYLSEAHLLFDENSAPTQICEALLKNFINAYAEWVRVFVVA